MRYAAYILLNALEEVVQALADNGDICETDKNKIHTSLETLRDLTT